MPASPGVPSATSEPMVAGRGDDAAGEALLLALSRRVLGGGLVIAVSLLTVGRRGRKRVALAAGPEVSFESTVDAD
jgi:hypothetical protein